MVLDGRTPTNAELDSTGTWRKLATWRPVPESYRKVHRSIESARHGGYLERPHQFAVKRDGEIRIKMMRDGACSKAIMLRRVLVAGTDWYLEAPTDEDKVLLPYFERLLKKVKSLSSKLFNLTAAIFEGLSFLRMLTAPGERRIQIGNLPDSQTGVVQPYVWWWPELVHIPAAGIGRDVEEREVEHPDGTTSKQPFYVWTTYDPFRDQWYQIDESDLWQYVRLEYQSDAYSLGFGEQLLDSMMVSFESKKHLERQLLRGAQRVAFPWVAIKIDEKLLTGGGTPGEGYLTPEQILNKWRKMFRKQEAGNMLVYGGSTQDVKPVNLEQGALGGLLNVIKHYNDEIVETAPAASMPTGGGGDNGSLARAAVEAGSTSRYIRSDIRQLEEAITSGLIEALWMQNWHIFSRIVDPATGRTLNTFNPPNFRIGREESDDYEKNANILTSVANLTDVLVSEIHEKCGTTQPTEEQIAAGETINLGRMAQEQAMAASVPPAGGEVVTDEDRQLQAGGEPNIDQPDLASQFMREEASRVIFQREFAGRIPGRNASRRANVTQRNRFQKLAGGRR